MMMISLPVYFRIAHDRDLTEWGIAKGWYWVAAMTLSLMLWWAAFQAAGLLDRFA
jgi:hypothetical protein